MKRLALFIPLALSLQLAMPLVATNTDIDDIKKTSGALLDALNSAWKKAAFKKSMKEGAKEFTTNFANQMVFAGMGIASCVLAGLGIKKLIDNRGQTDDQRETANRKRERRSAGAYIVLGALGFLISRAAINNIA